jgi:hypothetical protein
MVRSRWLWLLAFTLIVPQAVSAENWFYWRTWRSHWRENVAWPEQYFDADRSAARAPMQLMIANGWRAQNTISNYHFDEETGMLNDTGREKVHSVLFDHPPEWRTLYVLRGHKAEQTAARMKAVQDYALNELQGEPLPPVLMTTIEPRGTRGDVTQKVSTGFMENAPAPVLPQAQREDSGM